VKTIFKLLKEKKQIQSLNWTYLKKIK